MTDSSPAADTLSTARPGARSLGESPDPDDASAWVVSGRVATAVIVAAGSVIGVMMLTRPVFISHDSLSNNVHVWFIADRLWSGHGIPLHVPQMASGRALTFPYASIPWTTAALVWPLLGDRAVTLWLVVGFAATVLATFWTFPTLRRGWWAAATLTNPALVISPLLGQLPFLWSIAMFTFAIGFWRRSRVLPAVLLTTAASVTHPAVVMPIIAFVVCCRAPFEAPERRRSLVLWWLLSVALSLPAVWAVLQSPVVSETTIATQVGALLQTVSMRFLVLGVPLGLVLIQRYLRPPAWAPAVITVLFVLGQVPMYRPFGMDFAWGSLTRSPDPQIEAFIRTGAVQSGETYRVLTGLDGKFGLYAVVRAGGSLDAELFPEALHRGPFPSERAYAAFLRHREVDAVASFPSYTDRYTRSNEPELLRRMSTAGCIDGVQVTRRRGAGPWAVYDIDRTC